jgi:O-antigen/teichoic acid export membrane protein
MARTLRWALVLGVPAALIGMALAPWVVSWLYPPDLQGAAPVLQVLLLAAWWMTLDQLLSTAMLAAQAQRADLRCMLVGLGALVPLLVGLSLWQGAPGAAAALVLALTLRVLARLAWAQRALPVDGLLALAGRCLVAAAAALGVFAWAQAPHGVLIALLLGTLAYAAALPLVGGWTRWHAEDCRAAGQWWHARRQGGAA